MQNDHKHKKQIIDDDGNLLALVIDVASTSENKEFHTSNDLNFQIGTFNLDKGEVLQRHVHLENSRTINNTSEVLIVLKGSIMIEIYDSSKNFVDKVKVASDQIISFFQGGHSFEVLDDTKFIEIKQGPYNEFIDKEKF